MALDSRINSRTQPSKITENREHLGLKGATTLYCPLPLFTSLSSDQFSELKIRVNCSYYTLYTDTHRIPFESVITIRTFKHKQEQEIEYFNRTSLNYHYE